MRSDVLTLPLFTYGYGLLLLGWWVRDQLMPPISPPLAGTPAAAGSDPPASRDETRGEECLQPPDHRASHLGHQ